MTWLVLPTYSEYTVPNVRGIGEYASDILQVGAILITGGVMLRSKDSRSQQCCVIEGLNPATCSYDLVQMNYNNIFIRFSKEWLAIFFVFGNDKTRTTAQCLKPLDTF